jgi:tRNA(adenine34) deaminase
MAFSSRDHYWMQKALTLAEQAKHAGEVPVGAVLVHHDEVLAEGYNCPIATHDPTAHAEMVALRKGADIIKNYRLVDATLYVSLEPCMMCAGAIVHARIKRLVYGAADPRAGAVHSMSQCLDHAFLNHRVEYAGGLLAYECGSILSQFFKERR